MKFERFDKLARTDRVALLSALELLWHNGRAMIQSKDIPTLTASCVSSPGTYYTAEKLREIVTVCKELAGMETSELIRCLRCGGLEMKDPDAEEAGVCPICSGDLEYDGDEPLDDGGVYEWTCPSCGATGKEGYDKVFDRHYNVYDGDGNLYSAPSGSVQSVAFAVPEAAGYPPSPQGAFGGVSNL